MKYICPKCGSTFNEPKREHYAGDAWDACPNCGDPDFEAAEQCRGCRADKQIKDLVAREYCEDCITRATHIPELVRGFMLEPDIRENFAEWLTEIHWEPWREDYK